MPYYSWAHKCFLLLSSLWSKSRAKLDEYYTEFRRLMMANSRHILIKDTSMQNLFLPWDLFKFSVVLRENADALLFNRFVQNLSQCKGHYFNQHYMHEEISIEIDCYQNLIFQISKALSITESIEINNWSTEDNLQLDVFNKRKLIDWIKLTMNEFNTNPEWFTDLFI